jgi:hypothetical protein
MVAVVAPRLVDRPAAPHLTLYRPPPQRSGGPAEARRRCTPQVYRRRRAVALGALALVVVGAWALVRSVVAADAATTVLPAIPATAAPVWVVHPGDTLWSIALASGDRGDIRPLVDELSAEVHDQPLQVGERIALP